MSASQIILWLFVMTLIAGLAIGLYQRFKVRSAQKRDHHDSAEATQSFAESSAGRVGGGGPTDLNHGHIEGAPTAAVDVPRTGTR